MRQLVFLLLSLGANYLIQAACIYSSGFLSVAENQTIPALAQKKVFGTEFVQHDTLFDANQHAHETSLSMKEKSIQFACFVTMADTQYICQEAGVIDLTPWGLPVGGSWSSANFVSVSNNKFYPGNADTGFNQLYYRYTDSNGCTASDSMLVYVEPLPKIQFVADVTFGKSPFTVQFTNQSTGSYQLHFTWFFGDGDSSNQENPSHQYVKSGAYTVGLKIIGNYCSSNYFRADYIQVDSSGGVGIDLPEGKLIRVYPNPGNGIFQIEGVSPQCTFHVYDTRGIEMEIIHKRNGDLWEIGLMDGPPGTYVLQLDDSGKRYSLRLIKTAD